LIFAGLGLIGVVSYGLSGWKDWAWLFPAGVFGGLAATVGLAAAGYDSAAISSPLFLGLTLPFLAAYLTDRARHWWALIPGALMAFLTLTTLLVESAGGEWVGALFLFMVALAFLAVYLNNRTRWWALIPAYVFAVLGLAPLMGSGGRDAAYFGPLFLGAVALPFFVVYFRSPARWWAILPAGILTTTALIALFGVTGLIQSEKDGAYMSALMMGGLAATFAVVWLRHAIDWAKVVTLVFVALAIVTAFFTSYYQTIWPVAVILVGVYLIFRAMRPKPV
jgi:hypothetical protein